MTKMLLLLSVTSGCSLVCAACSEDSKPAPGHERHVELSRHFGGQPLRYLGEFHDSHVYVDPTEDNELANGYACAVFVAREDFLVLFRNPNDGHLAVHDPATGANLPNDLNFMDLPSDALMAKAWSIATGQSHADVIESGREGRSWAKVDVLTDAGDIEIVFVSQNVEIDADLQMEFTLILSLTEQRFTFFFDASGTSFAPVASDIFWTPLEDIEYRDVRKGEAEEAIWEFVRNNRFEE